MTNPKNAGTDRPHGGQSYIDLAGKVAIVTGGGAGMGRAISQLLATHGATVVVADISLAGAEETANSIVSDGGNASAVLLNVTDEDQVGEVTSWVAETYGRIDFVYNNAGITTLKNIEDMPLAEWQRVFDVNCTGIFLMSRAVIPIMRAQGHGRIINTASSAGKSVVPMQSHYAATKSAVIGFTRSLAIELKDDGILVNCFCPGRVLTEMSKREAVEFEAATGTPAAEVLAEWGSMVPLGGTWLMPEDIAKVAIMLASEYTEKMTGQAINITGGEILH
ncbi:SDR family NAD(P)-dependent oxidoreductase [Leucobacter komagatae]|uniref:Uncharacterized protein n=1 Tax=Leucobacter komagatae TaxID=55969 RepID=A0A0D0I1D5_9MICO|nr:SDR family NAD(P)-dependent oxidoreductase [Leucobacter komagatae]KIP53536.1 hypothetical protein SD72_02305 [Leucobacter komagatae]